jgi:hypothetical protein
MRCDVPSARKLYDSSAPTWILHVPDGRQFQTACFCRMHRNMQKLANMTCGGTTSKMRGIVHKLRPMSQHGPPNSMRCCYIAAAAAAY